MNIKNIFMECYMPYSVVNRVKYAYINKLGATLTDRYALSNWTYETDNKKTY